MTGRDEERRTLDERKDATGRLSPVGVGAQRADDGESLIVSMEGFEGPLDLLLMLARTQKVDLAKISVLALAEQYIAFIERARLLRIEVAADYLVMAAWLAFLKSRLLLPREEEDTEPDAQEMALRLQLRLQRLEAMREAAERLLARDRLGRDVFVRGAPEGLAVQRAIRHDATLFELLRAYGGLRIRRERPPLHIRRRPVYAFEEALRRLERLLGHRFEWAALEAFLPEDLRDPGLTRSALASMFAASLEMARLGKAELRQHETFGPIYMRGVAGTPEEEDES
ncbi:MAG: segregation/condensation protein A [Alphaproteobacteria bacterium]|nr:MAG: segregation/condensation protein A [Alphaproteobacteria bacterium]